MCLQQYNVKNHRGELVVASGYFANNFVRVLMHTWYHFMGCMNVSISFPVFKIKKLRACVTFLSVFKYIACMCTNHSEVVDVCCPVFEGICVELKI